MAHVHMLTGIGVGKSRSVNWMLVICSKIQVYFKQHYTSNSLKRVLILFNWEVGSRSTVRLRNSSQKN